MTRRQVLWMLVLTFLGSLALGSYIVRAAEQEKVVILLPESVNIQGPDLLLGKIATITGPEELVSQVEAINAGAAPLSGNSRRLTKAQIEVRLRQGGLDLKKIEFKGASTVQVYGVASAPVGTTVNQTEAGFPIYEVVVAVVDLPRGHVISPADITVEEQEFRSGQPDLRTVEEFVGLRTTRHILSGSPLTTLNVEVIPIIERGAQVTILVQTGSLVVTAPGIARGSGGVGEVISVENTLSRQMVLGEIIDAQTVQVNMRGFNTP
ncbi:MAG: flagellar basal body P-ring formation protein FlgA [Firmicutes bacterium]|nr:flagellar basal body P-ring formation protein FlgA [Bacillota bacterium]